MAEAGTTTRHSIGARRNPASAEAIRKAAEDILLEDGYAHFSIEAVAKRARAGKPTIYRWWPSKAALLLDVYHRQKREFVYPDTGSIEDDVHQFLRNLIGHWRETPSGAIFRLVIAEAQTDESVRDALKAYFAERLEITARMIRRARDRGELRDDIDAALAAEMIASFAWTRLLTDRLDESDESLKTAARQFTENWRA